MPSPMTTLEIQVDLAYAVPKPAEMLLQIEAAHGDEQTVRSARIDLDGARHLTADPGEADFGPRARFLVDDTVTCRYRATVEITRGEGEYANMPHTALTGLPKETLRYLVPSRYCLPSNFVPVLASEFSDLRGGALIAACHDWLASEIRYVPGASTSDTTAWDTYRDRQGICRDYAHVLISMARARGIPARFVACFAPDVSPQDFHAVAEVWLGGRWHLIDPTGMASASETARIAVGLDAADVAFLTIFGRADMVHQSVEIRRLLH